jgi:hypothetical protein
MIKNKVLEIFNSMTDDVFEFDMDPIELKNLCNALSLDLQLLKENTSDYTC